jgi:predicted aconitase with swiveling domain
MTTCGVDLCGRSLHPGTATGRSLRLEPLSFWGGTDLTTGTITDERHPQRGMEISGRVLVMRTGRGSSSSSSVLAEQLRTGVGPAAIVLAEPDAIIVVGAIVAAELYRRFLPVVQLTAEQLDTLPDDHVVSVHAGPTTARVRFVPHAGAPSEGADGYGPS